MAHRNIMISGQSHLTIKNKQLLITQQEKEGMFPLEDINCLLIESHQVTFNSYLLAKLSENNIVTILCDEKHLPCAELNSIHQHSRELEVFKAQINQPQSQKKQIWQQIIKAKIINQSLCLKHLDIIGNEHLLSLSKKVNSGDTQNIEAQAANFYFKALFGRNFTRQDNNPINSALNYGYALIRANLARTIQAYGFNSILGIFHHNELNNFNLVDDLIEPFRPIVDLFVAKLNPQTELNPQLKKELFSLLSLSIIVNQKMQNLPYAQELLVKNYKSILLKLGKKNLENIPKLSPIKIHTYE